MYTATEQAMRHQVFKSIYIHYLGCQIFSVCYYNNCDCVNACNSNGNMLISNKHISTPILGHVVAVLVISQGHSKLLPLLLLIPYERLLCNSMESCFTFSAYSAINSLVLVINI